MRSPSGSTASRLEDISSGFDAHGRASAEMELYEDLEFAQPVVAARSTETKKNEGVPSGTPSAS